MKSIFLASILAAAAFAVGGVILLSAGRPAAEDPDARSTLRDVGDRLGALTAEIGRLAERLEVLERRRAAPGSADAADTAAGTVADKRGAAVPVGADAGGGGADASASGSSLTTAAAREALSGGDPAKADELRQLVAQVIREDREERQRKQQEDAQARMRQWKELHDGPYGKYNYRVNSLAGKLGLTDAQKAYYHGILQEYEPRFGDLRKGVKWTDAESREAYEQSLDQLQQHFENTVKLGLDPDQRADYESLPTWERGAAGGAQVFVSGGDVAADVLTLPLPAPDGDASSSGVSVMEFETAVDGAGGGAAGTAVRIVVGGPDGPAAPPPAPDPPRPSDAPKAAEQTKPAPAKP